MLPTQHIIHSDLRCSQSYSPLSWQARSFRDQDSQSQRGSSLKKQGRVHLPSDKVGSMIIAKFL